MKRIPLEEAYEKATKGPLQEDKINAAVLAHAFNVLPDAVDVIEDLIRLTEITDIWIPMSWLDEAKAVLTKASTVEVPE